MRALVVLVGLIFGISVANAQAADFTEGKDYAVLAEQVTPADPSKIEVAEVFSYLCSHCYHFDPLVKSWLKKQPADVALVQTHASFNQNWPVYQRAYYTIVALGVKDKVHEAIFNATFVAQKEMLNANAWADFLSLYGVDKQKTLSTYNSFGVNSQIKQADKRVRDYKVTGTPTVVVDGRYKVLASKQEDILKVTQFLVDKVRAERAAKR